MAFELPPLPYADDALEPVYSAQDHQLPLRQAPQDLRRHAQQADRGHGPGRQVARGRHQGRRPRAALQQRRPGVEPHLLLERHEAGRRRRAEGELAEQDQRGLRRATRSSSRTSRPPPWAASAAAGPGSWRGRRAQDREHAERRDAAHHGGDAAAHGRRLGARLLPRLPEPAPGLGAGVLRQARELGLRRREPGARPAEADGAKRPTRGRGGGRREAPAPRPCRSERDASRGANGGPMLDETPR